MTLEQGFVEVVVQIPLVQFSTNVALRIYLSYHGGVTRSLPAVGRALAPEDTIMIARGHHHDSHNRPWFLQPYLSTMYHVGSGPTSTPRWLQDAFPIT